MSRDADAKTDPKTVRLYDKRIVDRNIKKGLLSRKDYEKHLKALDDIADKGVYGGPLEGDDDDRDDLDDVAEEEVAAEAATEAVHQAEDAAEEEAEDDEDDDEDDAAPGDGSPPGNNHAT